MAEIGAVSPETMQRILDNLNGQSDGKPSRENMPYDEDGIHFLNTTGEDIPPFGVFQCHKSNNTAFSASAVIAKRPIDSSANKSAIFVNGPHLVEKNSFGYAQPGPLYRVLHDGTAVDGSRLGLKASSFAAKLDSAGQFIAIGDDDISKNVKSCLLAVGASSTAEVTGMAVLLQDLGPATLSQDSTLVAGGFGSGRPTSASAKLVDLVLVPYVNPANPAYWKMQVEADVDFTIYNTTKIPFAAGSLIHWKTDYRSGLKLLDVHACFGTTVTTVVRNPDGSISLNV